MFPDSPTRTKIDLAGTWRYAQEDKEWNTVTVPSAYEGISRIKFMRTFTITPEMLDKYAFSLIVYGINYQSEISINGNFVGRHLGGYTSQVLPIPPNTLQTGNENTVIVTVDNELTPKTTLPLRQPVGGWKSYGGIFRDIYILATPKLYVESAFASTATSATGRSAQVTVSAQVTDHWSGIQAGGGTAIGFQVEFYNKLSGALVAKSTVSPVIPQANKALDVTVQATIDSVKLWSPEVPDLYVAKCLLTRTADGVASVIDEYSFDVGVRTFEWKEGRLHVNGTLTPLKGILWHETHPSYGSALTYEALERDIALIKSLNANLIRFPYPPHPYVLNMCDRYGLLVMEEIPLVNVPAEILMKDYFQDMAVNYLKEMIARDRVHPSVLAWGLGDQFETSSEYACVYVTNAVRIIKGLDTRAVYYCTRSLADQCLESVDIIGVNSPQEEAKDFYAVLKQFQEHNPGKPIVVTRYGRDVEPGNRNGYSDPRSMESQAHQIMKYYEIIKEAKIAGSVLWAFNDWRTDRPALTTSSPEPYTQTMGIVSADREKRVAFDVTRALFGGEKVQALPVGNYSPGAPIIYVFAGLVVLVTLAFFYNANRRFRDSVNRSLFRTYNFFADVRDQRILTYAQSIFLIVIISLTWATILSSILTHYRSDVLLDNVLSQFLTDGMKEWFVRLIWSPPEFILIISALIAVKIALLAILVMLFSIIVRTHVHFYHAFSITVWSMLPYVLLIPMAMILYRLMESDAYILPVFIIIAVVSLWVVIRLLKGISIIYDVYPVKVYASGLLIVLFVAAVLYVYFDYTQSASLYLRYLLQTARVPT